MVVRMEREMLISIRSMPQQAAVCRSAASLGGIWQQTACRAQNEPNPARSKGGPGSRDGGQIRLPASDVAPSTPIRTLCDPDVVYETDGQAVRHREGRDVRR